MYVYYFLLLLVCNSVLAEDCVTVDFENDFESDFKNSGVCATRFMWSNEQYSSINMGSPHPRSTSFVTPQSTMSCMSSFNFTMFGGGTLEVNRFMRTRESADYVIIEIFQYNDGGSVSMVATRAFGPSYSDSAQGWQTLRIPIPGSGRLNVYILFWGRALSTSIVLIDSLRYIGPSFDNDLCVIYKDEKTTVTEASTTTVAPTVTQNTTTTITTSTAPEATGSPTNFTTELSTTATNSTSEAPPTNTTITTPSPPTESPTNSTTQLSTTTTNTTEISNTTSAATTPPPSTTPRLPIQTPRLSISLLLLKIKKFFR